MIKARSGSELRIAAILVTVMGLLPMMGSFEHAQAQSNTRFFKETGQIVQGRFLEYWEQNGGLLQQGYPISDKILDQSPIDGKTYTMQYFERAVFEKHPENQPPNDVLLSLLGTLEYNRKYPNGAPDQHENHDAGAVQFAETGKWVGGSFLVYFNEHGGIRQQGLPISNEFQERSALDGQIRTVQYFERAVFEWNPDNQPPYNVLLAQLGTFAYKAKQEANEPVPPLLQPSIPAPLNPNNGQFYPHASGRYMVWNEGQIAGPVDRQQPSQFDIRALDMATNQAINVTNAPGNKTDPRLDGSLVTWRSENYGCNTCQDDGVYAEDLHTGSQYTIALDNETINSHVDKSPVVAGRYVAWLQISGNNQQRIMAKNVDNGAVIEARTLITGTEVTPDVQTQIGGLQGSQNFLVWSEISRQPLDFTSRIPQYPFNVYAYNLVTEQLSNIFTSHTNGYQVDSIPTFSLNAGQVLLADKTGNLTLINVATGAQKDIMYRGNVQQLELYGDKALVTADLDSKLIDGFGLASDEQQIVHLLQPDPDKFGASLSRFSATIAGDWLVWDDSAEANPRLTVKKLDLKATAQTPLTDAPAIPAPAKNIGQFSPRASDGYLYWQECEIANRVRRNCAIQSLDVKTSAVKHVVSGLDEPVEMAASGSSLAWSYRPTYCTEDCATAGIYLKDFDGAITTIETSTASLSNVAIVGQTVAWSESNHDGISILVKNLATGEIKAIAHLPPDGTQIYNMQISDEYIAWSQLDSTFEGGHKSDVKAYDRRSSDLGTVFAFDMNRRSDAQFSLDGHRIAVKFQDTFFIRDLQADKQVNLQPAPNAWGLHLRGNTLIYANSAIASGDYSGAERLGIYGVDISQPAIVQTLVAPQIGGFQFYGFTTLDNWLIYSDSNAQQPILNLLPLPDTLKQ